MDRLKLCGGWTGIAAILLLVGCSGGDDATTTFGTNPTTPVTMTAAGTTTGSPDETSTGVVTTGEPTAGSTGGGQGTSSSSTGEPTGSTGAPMPVCGDGAVDAEIGRAHV